MVLRVQPKISDKESEIKNPQGQVIRLAHSHALLHPHFFASVKPLRGFCIGHKKRRNNRNVKRSPDFMFRCSPSPLLWAQCKQSCRAPYPIILLPLFFIHFYSKNVITYAIQKPYTPLPIPFL
jgi:hypothetical protein